MTFPYLMPAVQAPMVMARTLPWFRPLAWLARQQLCIVMKEKCLSSAMILTSVTASSANCRHHLTGHLPCRHLWQWYGLCLGSGHQRGWHAQRHAAARSAQRTL